MTGAERGRNLEEGSMKRLLLVLSGTLLLTACLGSVEPAPERNYGFIIMDATANGENYSTLPLGIFYRSPALALPDLTPRDFCYEGLHDSTGVVVNPSLSHLDPGQFINVSVSGSDAEMVPFDTLSAEIYRPHAPLAFTPGDSAIFESSGGADFAPFVIRAKTAEPFTMNPVGLPAAGASLPLSWTAAPSPGSKMIVSLRWANEGEPNTIHLLYCDLVDDGAFAVPSSQVIGWRLAHTRQVVATRERVASPATVGATLRVISNFEVQVPVNQ